jgi:hypothetical protein
MLLHVTKTHLITFTLHLWHKWHNQKTPLKTENNDAYLQLRHNQKKQVQQMQQVQN